MFAEWPSPRPCGPRVASGPWHVVRSRQVAFAAPARLLATTPFKLMHRPAHDPALVVDDDPFFRIALSKILTDRLGCVEISEAASFDSALERLAERPGISVALFDLAMPGMSSPMNLGVIRETFPQTLVVMISASSARGDVISALQAGAHGYVPKSLGVAGIVAALQTIFEGTIYVPASLSDVVTAGQALEEACATRADQSASFEQASAAARAVCNTVSALRPELP